MPSHDVNTAMQLAEASWRGDKLSDLKTIHFIIFI